MAENKFPREVAAVCIYNNKALLIEHVFGKAERIIDIPRGEVLEGETPWDAVKRIVFEQTNVEVEVGELLGVKLAKDNEYMAFKVNYVSGDLKPEQRTEWWDLPAVCLRIETPDISKKMVKAAVRDIKMKKIDCDGIAEDEILYGIR